MTIKPTTIKTKKHNLIIYNEHYLAIDGAYIIADYLVRLDNEELQAKIFRNEPFVFNNGRLEDKEPPKLQQLIPALSPEFQELEDTELIADKRTKCRIFHNNIQNYFTQFDYDYLKQFTKTGIRLKLQQKERLSGAGHYNPNLECIFYIMPNSQKTILDKFNYKEVN